MAVRTERPAAPVSVERICRAALALIDEKGTDAFTLERLAARLGVRAPSLYNHVGSKAEIIEGVRDLVVAEMDYSMFATEPWDEALVRYARSYRSAFAAHPRTVALLFMTPVRAAGTYTMYEVVARALSAAGWPDPLLIPVLSSVEYLIAGSLLDRSALGDMLGGATTLGAPTLARGLSSAATQVEGADRAFEFALSGLISGLRAEFAGVGDGGPTEC